MGQLIFEYDRLSRHRYQKQLASVKRHALQKDWTSVLRKYPFPWSSGRLARMQRQEVNISSISDSGDAAALTNLEMFHNFIQTWGHHPRLDALSNDFTIGDGFYHAMTIFACLREFYLRDVKVGIAPPPEGGSRTADLYIRHGVGQKFHLEVKTPVSLQYPDCLKVDANVVCDTAIKALRSARGQLASTKPGLLVLGLTFIMEAKFPEISEGLAKAIGSVGANYSGVAGILLLAPRFKKTHVFRQPSNQFGHERTYHQNQHFAMDNAFSPIFSAEVH